MKKLLLAATAFLLLASCGGKRRQLPAADSGPIWDSIYRADSVRAEDSLARIDSLERARALAHEDSLRAADSLRRLALLKETEGTKPSPHFREIAELLGKYDLESMNVEEFITNGEFHPGPASVAKTFYEPAMEHYRQLKKLEGEMTPDQKAHFEKINRRIRPALPR